MISNAMIWIADHPSDPWLEEYLKSFGYPVFKYGETKEPKKVSVKTDSAILAKNIAKDFDAQDELIKHLASKVRV